MIIIGLGANLPGVFGTPQENIQKALSLMPEFGLNVVSASSTWKSAPVPMSDQPWYHNAVCEVESDLVAHDVLKAIARIEDMAGRVRRERNAARVLDLDLLVYNDDVIEDDILSVPHPRMHERAFVLLPLQEIASDWMHPTIKQPIDYLVKQLPNDQKIERIGADNMPLAG